MGVVYAATDPLIGRPVAIKTIRLGNLDVGDNREELTRRLYREAQSAGILSHPGIITIHDVGEQGEDAYIVMEFVDGKSLEGLLASGVPQPSGTLLLVLRKAAAALDYAHSKGIIHRDIKPANIMICHDGTVKIADFGVAKLAASTSMTQSGLVLGTPSYMSPEQAQGRTIDGRSDQFSLAVVAYRMLTGKLPFEASTLTALLTKILWEEPDYEGAGLHPPLLLVFRKALSKDPQLRFASCVDFVQQLEAAYAQHRTQLLDNIPESAPGPEGGLPAEEIPVLPGAAGMVQISTPEQPSLVLPSAEMPAVGEDKSKSQSLPIPQPEVPAEAPEMKKARLIGWAACLGVVALAAVAFVTIKILQKPAPSIQGPSSDAASVQGRETPAAAVIPPEHVQDNKPPIPASPPSRPAAPPTKPQKGASSQPALEQPDSVKIAPPKAVVSPPKRVEFLPKSSDPGSGTIVWSGELKKNALLIIEEQRASIGSVTGKLPGKPVRIEVEPKEVIIRQMPGAANGWKLIVLYSGGKEYSSISVRWRIIN